MIPDRLVAGLDIGTATTTALIGEVVGDLPRNPVFKVLGVGPARGRAPLTGSQEPVVRGLVVLRCVLGDLARVADDLPGAHGPSPPLPWRACPIGGSGGRLALHAATAPTPPSTCRRRSSAALCATP